MQRTMLTGAGECGTGTGECVRGLDVRRRHGTAGLIMLYREGSRRPG